MLVHGLHDSRCCSVVVVVSFPAVSRSLSLGVNRLSGSLPSQLAACPVHVLNLTSNAISGSFPSGFVAMKLR